MQECKRASPQMSSDKYDDNNDNDDVKQPVAL